MSWIFLEIPPGVSWKSPGNLFSYICRHPDLDYDFPELKKIRLRCTAANVINLFRGESLELSVSVACEMESLLVSDAAVRNGLVDGKTNVTERIVDKFGNFDL